MEHRHFDTIDSTNEQLKRFLSNGERDLLLTASQQTAGRGRRGHTFHSVKGGLYLSMDLPYEPAEEIPITILAGAACSMALTELCEREVSCKWVNDLLLDGKKVGGVLAELHQGRVVLGIGINVNQSAEDFPPELAHASSLKRCCNRSFDLEIVCHTVLKKWSEVQQNKDKAFCWYKNHLLNLHRRVRVCSAMGERFGTAIDLQKDGALLLHFEDSGVVESIQSAEVFIRGMDSYM